MVRRSGGPFHVGCSEMFHTMVLFVFVMLLATLMIVVVAGLVVAYVAYPHQGKDIPRAEWLSDAMKRAVDRWGVRTERADESRAGEERQLARSETSDWQR